MDLVTRRALLVAGLNTSFISSLPRFLQSTPPRMKARGKVGDIGGAVVPSAIISVADFGGRPGAGRAALTNAFNRAFDILRRRGGGTLFVPPGIYDFGSYVEPAYIILCRDLRNVAISAYGAIFAARTSANVVPNMFYFVNFQNVTIAGASFVDLGFNPWVNWRGMYCVGIQANETSFLLRMVDCYAQRVVGLLASNNNKTTRQYISHVSVQAEVQNSYYGVGSSYIKKNVDVELVCHNVRRAFISASLNTATIKIKATNSAFWPGSNGLVSLATSGTSTGNVENVLVKVDVSGECIHSAYVHFYHQGPEISGYMRDIDATVNVLERNSDGNLFLFDHEVDRILSKTGRTWDRISLHGTVADNFRGEIISNPSVTTSPGTIYIDHKLAKALHGKILAAGFHVR
ncbi:MAG: hypothetical protein ACJ8HJ_15235 [Massilia sp.]